MNSDDMYSEMVLDHFRNPRNFGSLNSCNVSFKDSNPICGDVVQVDLKIVNKKIIDCKFSGSGCAISQVSTDLLLDKIKDLDINAVKSINKDDMFSILGFNVSPLRVKCALLGLKVLKCGVYSYIGGEFLEDDYDKA